MLDFGSHQLISCILISRGKKVLLLFISNRGLSNGSSLSQDLLFKYLASQMFAAFALAMEHILSIHSSDENMYCLPVRVQAQLALYCITTFSVSVCYLYARADDWQNPSLSGSNNEQREAHKSSVMSRVPTKLGLHSNGCWKGFREFLGVMQVY